MNALAAFRLTLRPLAAAVALAIASGNSFGLAGDESAAALPEHRRDVIVEHFVSRRLRGDAITVQNCNDDGPGSLREAYAKAPDGAQIDLTQLSCSAITLTSGALADADSTNTISLIGPGKYRLSIYGGYLDRVLVHRGNGTLGISNLRIARGGYSGTFGGGCIYSHGNVDLDGSIVTACQIGSTGTAKALGGAIYAYNDFSAFGSEVSNGRAHAPNANSAGGAVWANDVSFIIGRVADSVVSSGGGHYARGGGIYALRNAHMTYMTLTNNEAATGGAVFLLGAGDAMPTIVNSTISGNRAHFAGGGVYAKYQPLGLWNSTVTLNSAGDAGGGVYLAADLDLESAIVAGNTSGDAATPSDIGGQPGKAIIGANNLVVASLIALPSGTLSADPLLGPLRYNGGFTQTHALLPGSPAIDQGNNDVGALYDQRCVDPDTNVAFERAVGPRADIGAFESGAPDRLFHDGFEYIPHRYASPRQPR